MGKEQEGGRFIVLEGIEGVGKTLQAKLLREALSEMGYQVVLTYEPGGKVRQILLDPEFDLDSKGELCLFLAGRRQNVVEVIIPALPAGKIVISDRYEGSTFAYQSYAGQLPLEEVRRFNDFITDGLKPNLTILIDIDVEESRARLGTKDEPLSGFDAREIAFHHRVREGYLDLAQSEENWVVINGSGSIEEIHQRILEVLAERKILP